jgi:tetratricopeptide (TPR) repeat protein
MKRNFIFIFGILTILYSCQNKNSQLWESMADDQFDKGNISKSLEYINKAISITPKRSILFFKRALYYNDMKKYEFALNSIDSSIIICDTIYTYYSIKAKILGHLHKTDSALKYFAKAIKIRPHNPRPYQDRGLMYYEINQFEDAMNDFDKALSIDSTYISTYYYKARIKSIVNKDFDGAISDFTKMIDKFKPKTMTDKQFLASAYLLRGTCYDITGRINAACTDWNKAKDLGLKEAIEYIDKKCNK